MPGKGGQSEVWLGYGGASRDSHGGSKPFPGAAGKPRWPHCAPVESRAASGAGGWDPGLHLQLVTLAIAFQAGGGTRNATPPAGRVLSKPNWPPDEAPGPQGLLPGDPFPAMSLGPTGPFHLLNSGPTSAWWPHASRGLPGGTARFLFSSCVSVCGR